MMSVQEMIAEGTVKDLLLMVLVFFWWPLFFGTIYVLLFKKTPFKGVSDDVKFMKEFLTAPATGNYVDSNRGRDSEDPDDYWDDEQAYANRRPTVRNPKNADRAYWGGAERFHHGGGENS